mmetsp:Transcript_23159/g.59528  ORF Transcript_23159/g.59528 Transcript_23159/m.59528 type:complete len:447 (-) Transcript_23159:244-1584(-)
MLPRVAARAQGSRVGGRLVAASRGALFHATPAPLSSLPTEVLNARNGASRVDRRGWVVLDGGDSEDTQSLSAGPSPPGLSQLDQQCLGADLKTPSDASLPVAEPRKLCSLGTGEVVHILSFRAKDDAHVEPFERIVQRIAYELHEMHAGVSDVRVCHPQCGEATFVVTVVSEFESQRFKTHIAPRLSAALAGVCADGGPTFSRSGSLMPQAHSLSSLLDYLQTTVIGKDHTHHDIASVRHELAKWFPRREEYTPFVHWDEHDPSKYTRNIIHSSEELEVLLMCWPPHTKSSIHCHDESSCWVSAVEGQVVEVQYQLPKLDRAFLKKSFKDPTGAVGRCGPLKVTNVVTLGLPDSPQDTYANNEIGIHRIENRTDEPAITLHVYAPRLRKMTVFREVGDHSVATVAAVSYMSEGGEKTGLWSKETHPDGVIDVDAWNRIAAAEAQAG